MLTQPFIKGLDGSIQSETFVNRNMITDIVHICLKDSEDSLLGFCRVVSTDTTGVVKFSPRFPGYAAHHAALSALDINTNVLS